MLGLGDHITRHCRLRLGNPIFHYVLTRTLQRRGFIDDVGATGHTLDNISTDKCYRILDFGAGALRVTWPQALRLAFELNLNI